MLSRLSFRTKIILGMMALLLLFGTTLAVVVSRTASRALLEESRKRGLSTAVHVATRIGEPLLAMNLLRMKDVVDEALRTNEDTVFVFIQQGRQGKPVVHTFTGGIPVDLLGVNDVSNDESHRLRLISDGREIMDDFAVPVVVSENRLGTVRLGVSHRRIDEARDRLLWAIIGTGGAAMGAAVLLGALLARTVTRRVEGLRRSAEEIVRGNLDVHAAASPSRSCWELQSCTNAACPAYGDHSQRCWYLTDTLCPTCANGDHTTKMESCRNCDVHRANAGDEIQDLAEYFDLMTLTLKRRMGDLETTQNDLREQRHLLQSILDATPDLVSLVSVELRYRAVNRAFGRFFGLNEQDVSNGLHIPDLLLPEPTKSAQREDRLVMETGAPLQLEKALLTHDGEERWFHMVKTPVVNAEGTVTGVLCTARDITEFKKLQERIVQSQKLESLGQLAAGVAHELNTPLGIILGYTQLLLKDFKDGPESAELNESLRIMEKHLRICKKIVADLLRFARNTETTKKPLQINEEIEQVLAIKEHTLHMDRIVLERHFAADLPRVLADVEKLQQVFLNLLNNAHDAIGPDCGGRVTVTTWQDAGKGEVLVAVEDTGSGISPEIKDKIFDPFFTTKAVGQGTGLGLAVTFGIVKDHGGYIEVKSSAEGDGGGCGGREGGPETDEVPREKPGTVFILHLPAHEQTV